MLKMVSERKALDRLRNIQLRFRRLVSEVYEPRAKNCITCETQGACCLDAHFVNVHVSLLEAVAIKAKIATFEETLQVEIAERIKAAIRDYRLTSEGDTYEQKFACPLFDKGTGCLVHDEGKPVACTMHACYENEADLPPDSLQIAQEQKIDDLNNRTYGTRPPWLPLPLAIRLSKS